MIMTRNIFPSFFDAGGSSQTLPRGSGAQAAGNSCTITFDIASLSSHSASLGDAAASAPPLLSPRVDALRGPPRILWRDS